MQRYVIHRRNLYPRTPRPLHFSVLSVGSDRARTLRGAVWGAVAATVWAVQQPLDKRVFGCSYDDVELLGRALVRGDGWYQLGLALHVQNGALFGALYARVAPSLPLPPALRGPTVALTEHLVSWPLVALADRLHPARDRLPRLAGNRRAFSQALWRHLLFGLVLGELERRLGAVTELPARAPREDYSPNGHGRIQDTVTVTAYGESD
jgi:hypothetical protein